MLLAWYPLNGTLEDYSGNNNPVLTSSGVAWSDSGKIGKCYAPNGSSYIRIENPIKSLTKFTICFWMKESESDSWSDIFTITDGVSSNSCRVEKTDTIGTYRWYINGCFTNGVVLFTNNINTWQHVALKSDGVNVYCYVNGIQTYKSTINSTNKLPDLPYIHIAMRDTASKWKGSLNDFRIYDEALSLKEIKEIAKAKILHYNFNKPTETTVNLAPIQTKVTDSNASTAMGWDTSLHSDAILVSNWSGGYNSGVTSPKVGYHASWVIDKLTNKPIIKFPNINNSNGLTLGYRWLGITCDIAGNKFVAGKTYTFSWEQRVDEINQGCWIGLRYRKTDSTSYGFYSSTSGVKTNSIVGAWERKSYTFSLSTLYDSAYVARIYIYGYREVGQGTSYVRNIQLEEKDNSTQFTQDSRIDYVTDSSGFRNHSLPLQLSSSPEWSERGVIGTGCHEIKSNKRIFSKLAMSGSYYAQSDCAMTISCWIKLTSHATSGTVGSLVGQIYYSGFGITIQSDGSTYTKIGAYFRNTNTIQAPSTNVELNTLYHCVAIFDNTIGKVKIYLNGELKNSANIVLGEAREDIIDSSFAINRGTSTMGSSPWCYMNGGIIDDVRLYATALSDEDIKGLYQSRGSVSKNGKLLISEITESDNLFNPNLILARQGELGINKSSKLVEKDGVKCLAISASSFYKNSTYYSIFPDGYFKKNTQYRLELMMNGNLIYQGSEVPFGFVVYYTDGTKSDFSHKTGGEWKKCSLTTAQNKTIERIGVYYYIGDLFYLDINNCSIRELSSKNTVNKKGQLITNEIYENNYTPSLIDYSNWSLESADGWSNNGSASENCRVVYSNPRGNMDIMWATLSNDAESNSDGGFHSPQVNIDNTKKYRFSVWIRRENIGDGRTYFGLNAYDSAGTENGLLNLSDTSITNPYFTNFAKGHAFYDACNNEWCLFVAYVQPSSYSGDNEAENGVYKKDGTRVGGVSGYKWSTTASKARLRAYLYYSTSTAERQYFYRPRIDLCDGSEPTIQELLSCNEHLPLADMSGRLLPKNTFSFGKNGCTYSTEFIEN